MAKRLLELMDRKKTNLCVSVDVTTTAEVLEIVKAAGESICMVKVSLWLAVLLMKLVWMDGLREDRTDAVDPL